MIATANDKLYTDEEIEHLSSVHFINKIDIHLKSVASMTVIPPENNIPEYVTLSLEIYYEGSKVDTMTFNLQNYDYQDVLQVAKNIHTNQYILQEVDNLLAGDIE